MPEPLRIAYVTSEMVPFAKTGGLADVSAALPKALGRLGHEVTVFLPRYGAIAFPPGKHQGSVHVPVDNVNRSAGFYRKDLGGGVSVVFLEHPPLFDRRTLGRLGLDEADLAADVARERAELGRRALRYRGGRPAPDVRDRTVVLVDDGLATGVTARAALRHLRRRAPARLILAVPVGAPEAVAALRREADDVLCPSQPPDFGAVGLWYDDFAQVADEEVIALLDARRPPAGER